ncbi:GNAT family N-acetyltransferase [Dankookia sp. GCM10030260]|uniref:GNAT family N-acetyltransferase n=1 Tax=Dankookia sp. GCM10030260 TaxID=3273390 RepID=UPI0036179796
MELHQGAGSSMVAERSYSIRRLIPQDVEALAILWAEMQRHYGKPVTEIDAMQAAIQACDAQQRDGFEPRILVANVLGSGLAGAIVLNVSFPANELSRSLYIRDLYVAADMRRCGVARALLRAAAALTLCQGFSALDWTAEVDNLNARKLYSGEGARQLPRVYYRLDTIGMQQIAECENVDAAQ